MNSALVSINLLREVQELGLMKELAVFLKLKTLYSSSAIHGTSIQKIREKSGFSTNMLKHCMKVFRDRKWIREHDGMIVFKRMGSIDKSFCYWKNVYRVEFKCTDGYRVLVKKLRLLFVRDRHDCFNFIKKVSSDLNNPTSLQKYKRAIRLDRQGVLKSPIGAGVEFSISNKSVGSMFGRSQSTGSRLMQWAQKELLISKKERYVTARLQVGEVGGKYFFRNGRMFERMADIVSFS